MSLCSIHPLYIPSITIQRDCEQQTLVALSRGALLPTETIDAGKCMFNVGVLM